MATMQPDYLSYLLRLWRVDGDNGDQRNPAVWRASLENPHTGERKGFAGLDELFDFLQAQTEEIPRYAEAKPPQKNHPLL